MKKIQLEYYPYGTIANEKLSYALIVTFYRTLLVCVRQKGKNSWEFPAGHREKNEQIIITAHRELEEETAASLYHIVPAFDYSVRFRDDKKYGSVFKAEVDTFDVLPDFEIAEVAFFNKLPLVWTYPEIQPKILTKLLKQFEITF